MSFAIQDRLKALAIVHIFETSKPFGGYAACVVLNDGAGISYGINQFTHRSGSLHAVTKRYLENGGAVGRAVIESSMALLASPSKSSIRIASENETLKKALKAAAVTSEMRRAQEEIAFELYLAPALAACEISGFVLPLSLAVIYDSINHGSWEKIRDRVSVAGIADSGLGLDETRFERDWIAQYVAARHKWLGTISRLRSTRYRTQFFIEQVAVGNWHLDLPLNVNGTKLTAAIFKNSAVEPTTKPANEPAADAVGALHNCPSGSSKTNHDVVRTDKEAQPPNCIDTVKTRNEDAERILDTVETHVNSAAEKFDRVEAVVTTVAKRTDAAKSLWTTIVGTIWQTAWAVFTFAAGMPREVWLVAALIAGVLMIFYLYRQITLGKIRESSECKL